MEDVVRIDRQRAALVGSVREVANAGDDEVGARARSRLIRRRSTLSHIEISDRIHFVLDGAHKATIGEFIDDVGFGPYQVHQFLISSGALLAEAAIIGTISSVVLAISIDFGIASELQKSLFSTCLFIGIQLGTVVSGPLGDLAGRRWPLLLGYGGMVMGSSAAVLAPSASVLLAFLILIGVSAGICVPAAMITVTEVMPSCLRGLTGAAIGMAWRLGGLWSAFGLRLFMPGLEAGPWRRMLLWTIAPAVLFLAFALASPTFHKDTPYFLAIHGDSEGLVSSINLLAEMNGRPDRKMVFDASLRKENDVAASLRETIAILVAYPYWMYFCCMTVLFFCKEFVAAGLVAFWPVAFASIGSSWAMTPATGLLITTALGIPGIFVSMYLMDRLPRRHALWTGTCITGISALLLLRLDYATGWQAGQAGVAAIQLFFPTWQMVTMLLVSEMFPTQVRGWAFSLSFFLGRFGCEAAQVFVHTAPRSFLIVCACLAGLAAFVGGIVPETRGVELANFPNEPKKVSLPTSSRGPIGVDEDGYGATDAVRS